MLKTIKSKILIMFVCVIALCGICFSLTENTENAYAGKLPHTITYVNNNDTANTTAKSDSIVFPETSPIKTGYFLDSWYTDSTLKTRAVAGSTISADITLYAKWVEEHTCNDYTSDHLLSIDSSYLQTDMVWDYLLEQEVEYKYYALKSGIYYLNEDITLQYDIKFFANNAVICLNGHILDLGGYSVYSDADLEIYDCREDITPHNYKVDNFGIWTLTSESATKTVESLTARPSSNDIIAVKGGAITNGTVKPYCFKAEKVNFVGCFGVNEIEEGNIINCNFYGCYKHDENGSAIGGNNINIYNSVFKYNTADDTFGTIYCEGKLLVKNCIIQYNEADKGAGIFADYNVTIVTIMDSTISDNTASENGAGISFGDGKSCFTEGTLITMADGTTKAIEEIAVGDSVKSLNHESGLYESKKVTFIYKGDSGCYFTLNFENEITLNIVNQHDLFCQEDNKYVTITKDGYGDYIGKHFYNATTNSWVELLSVDCDDNYAGYYSLYVENTMNCIANDMLTCPDDMDFVLNMYEFTSSNYLKADSTVLANDIGLYGLCVFSDCKLIETETEYNAFNIKYYNIWIGKGLLTARTAKDLYYEGHNYNEYSDGIEGPALIIGKNVTIQNNKVGEKTENVYLSDGVMVYVIDGATDINVGITLENVVGDFAIDVYANNIGFTSDNNKLNIIKTATEQTFTYSLSYLKEQPTKKNDYTVVVNDNLKEEVTYQWYEDLGTYKLSELDNSEFSLEYYGSTYSDTISAQFVENYDESDSYVVSFYFNKDVPCFIYFDSDEESLVAVTTSNSVICSHKKNHYIAYSEGGEFAVFSIEYGFSLENITIQKVKKLSGETNAKFGSTTLNDSSYFCAIFDDNDEMIETSKNITPKVISFDKNGATGTAPATVYQLEGRKITLPENTLVKTDCKFLGWNTSSTASTALTFTNNQYTVGSSDVTFYAIWQSKTITLDTSLQRIIYDGNAKKPDLKDTNGNAITLDGFSYTYEMYYKNNFDSCADTKEPGLYKAHITRAEDEEFFAVDSYIEFVVTYSLTYKANTGVGEDVVDISDNDTIHKDYFGSYVETAPETYEFDAQAIIKANTYTKENYTFAFWNTKQDGTGTSYNPEDLLTLTDNTVLYACYSANISKQPDKGNNYTVGVATTDTVSYVWEKEVKKITPVDLSQISGITGAVNSTDGKITATYQGGKYQIVIPTTSTKKLMFYTEGTLSDGVVGVDKTYIYSPKVKIKAFFIISGSAEFTISDINYYSLEYTAISGETASSISNANENTSYRCVVKSQFNAVSYSSTVSPDKVSFNGGTGATGTAPSDMYQLEGRKITLPANTFTKTGYAFIGWNTDKDATTKLDDYTMGSTDVTLYAIWKEKLAITVTETTQYFNVETKGSDIAFAVTGTNIPTSGLSIGYRKYGTKDEFSENLFATAQKSTYYDVKITYTEDGTYKALDLTVTKGIALYISVIYHNTDATSGTVPTDSTKYIYSDLPGLKKTTAQSNSGNLARTGYTFDGWYYFASNITSSKNVDKTEETGYIPVKEESNNIYVYPNWKLNLKEISKSNDYEVKSDADLTNCTYQWSVESTYKMADLQMGTMEEVTEGTKDYCPNNPLADFGGELEISFALRYYTEGSSFRFKSVNGYYSYDDFDGEYYIREITENCYHDTYFSVMLENCYCELDTIYDFEIVYNQEITGETKAKVGNVIQGQKAYCVVSYSQTIQGMKFDKTVTTNKVAVKTIKFDGNGATGTAPTTQYKLEGRAVTLPANSFTKTGYKFIGWNTNKTATTKLDDYTTESTDVTLYAVWKEKTAVSVTETAQEKTYNGKKQGFNLLGTHKDLTGFTIQYAIYNDVAHGDDDWSTTEPTNVDIYDVKITRAEDATYKAYEKVISKGFVIGQYAIPDSDVTLCQDNFVYNGSDQHQKLTASYKDALGNTVSLRLSEFTPRINPKSEETFTDCAVYDVWFMFDSDLEMINYIFESTESEYFYTEYEMKKKEIVIDWANDNYTYNGQAQTITATYKDVDDQDINLTVSIDKTFQNAGSYTATASFANDETNYKLPTIVTKSYTIGQVKVTKPTEDTTVFTYDGSEQTYTLTANSLYTISDNTRKNAGSQTVTVALNDKDNYCWTDKTTTDLTFTFTIHKANAVITVDQTEIVKTYGESVTIPQATSNYGEVSCDKVASDFVNAGSYTITYTVAEAENYNGDTKSVNVTIKKIAVNEPVVVGSYKYTGEAQTVELSGEENYMTTNDTFTQTEVGVYTIAYTLDSNYTWEIGSDGIVTWEIRAIELKSNTENAEDKPQVEVQTEEGFDSSITVTVEITIEADVKSKELTVDYYNLTAEDIKLSDTEKIGIIVDVKLIQTIDGVSREIQPSDIKEGTILKVRMLIPSSIDVSKITRILHVHSADDIEELPFDASKIDKDGYYEMEIDRLSEFAFIYQKEEPVKCLNHWYILGIILLMIILLAMGAVCPRERRYIAIILNIICIILLVVSFFLIACDICKAFFIAGVIALVFGFLLEIFFAIGKYRR